MKKLFLLIAVITALFTAACGKSGKAAGTDAPALKGPVTAHLCQFCKACGIWFL